MPITVVRAGINARNEKVASLAHVKHNVVFAYQQRHVVTMASVCTSVMMPIIVVRAGINARNEKVAFLAHARHIAVSAYQQRHVVMMATV